MGKDIRLNALRKKFQAYCHEENCRTIDICPEECDCEKELDLDTAIAWNTATTIKKFIRWGEDDPSSHLLGSIVYGYYAILIYHQKKYEKLFGLIREACELVVSFPIEEK